MNDSWVASFLKKCHYNFWRPETAIHAGDTDGNPKANPDPTFVPFIVTPCFPNYPSNHGCAGNGAAKSVSAMSPSEKRLVERTHPDPPSIAKLKDAPAADRISYCAFPSAAR